jgi:hypothetical protein
MIGRVTSMTSLAVICLLVLGGLRPAQAQLGVAAGLNFEDFGDIDTGDGEAAVDNATGWHAGIFYDLELGPFALRPGVFYSRVDNLNIDYNDGNVDTDFDLSQVRVPIDIRFRILPAGIRPYVLGAPVFSFASGSGDFGDNIKNLHVAADVGAGIEIALGGLRLMPELRYSFGLSSILEDEIEIGDATFDAEDGQKLNTFMLRLGLIF